GVLRRARLDGARARAGSARGRDRQPAAHRAAGRLRRLPVPPLRAARAAGAAPRRRGALPVGCRGGARARRGVGPGPRGTTAPGDLRRARAPSRGRRAPRALAPALTPLRTSAPDVEEAPSPLKEPGTDHSAEPVRSTSHT